MNDADRRAWAYLSRVAEPPCAELAVLVAKVGAVEAAERVRSGAVGADLSKLTEARREIDCVADDLNVLDRLGGRLLTPDCEDWPLLAFAGLQRAQSGSSTSPNVPARLSERGLPPPTANSSPRISRPDSSSATSR